MPKNLDGNAEILLQAGEQFQMEALKGNINRYFLVEKLLYNSLCQCVMIFVVGWSESYASKTLILKQRKIHDKGLCMT